MRIKKVLSMMLMVAILSVGFVGCGSAEKPQEGKPTEETAQEEKPAEELEEKKTFKIGVAGESFADKWQTYLYDAIEAQGAKMDGVEVILTDAKNDSSIQMANVENLINQGADAIVMVIIDNEGAKPFVKMCNDAGVKLIGVNRPFEGADVYVGSESIESGLLQMEAVAELMGGKGNVAILQGTLGHEAVEARTAGNEQIIEQYPDIEIVRMETGKWDRGLGMEVAETWLESGLGIDAIVSNNDEMAIGAILALKAKGDTTTIVAGIDATIDALEYVVDGSLDVTVFQNPFEQGAQAVITAVNAVKGEDVGDRVLIPYEIVTKDNVDEYIAKWQ